MTAPTDAEREILDALAHVQAEIRAGLDAIHARLDDLREVLVRIEARLGDER